MIRVLFFGSLRDRHGLGLELADPVATVADVWVRAAAGAPASPTVRAARNRVYCDWSSAVEAGDEVAFMPPMSGG